MIRECRKCGVEKPWEEFAKDSRRKSGIQHVCKKCKASNDKRRTGEKISGAYEEVRDALSLGAGVQSSTVLLMSHFGELPPLDVAVFADTGWEPAAVYRHLEWMESLVSIPILRVTAGNIREDALGETRFASMPLYVDGGRKKEGMLRRQCTQEYKIRPIRGALYEWVERRVAKVKVRQWMGISADEPHRMKTSDVGWIENWYPLVEQGITRDDCLSWWADKGFSPPPRSACIGCPYRSNQEWMNLTEEEFRDAVVFDDQIRTAERMKERFDGQVFLHSQRVPLGEVKLSGPGTELWGEECEGMCGI